MFAQKREESCSKSKSGRPGSKGRGRRRRNFYFYRPEFTGQANQSPFRPSKGPKAPPPLLLRIPLLFAPNLLLPTHPPHFPITLKPHPQMTTRVYLGRLSREARERDVERLFKGYGDIREINIKNGFGFVEFRDHKDAEDVVYDFHGKEFLGERYAFQIHSLNLFHISQLRLY